MAYDPDKVLTFEEGAELILSDSRGIYIPKGFAEGCYPEKWGVSQEDIDILLAGPDHEHYWETWDRVLQNAERKMDDGRTFRLYQDGDCWAVDSRVCWDCSDMGGSRQPCPEHGPDEDEA